MDCLRIYGRRPFNVALIHGGPGAFGEMQPVALGLEAHFGILEPFQTTTTLPEQIEELGNLLEQHADLPVSLVGFSWGAWLSYLVTAEYPELVKKLILVGSGPYEPEYVQQITETRLSRLTEDEGSEYHAILHLLSKPNATGKTDKLKRLGQLANKADHYDPIKVQYTRPKSKSFGGGGNEFHVLLNAAQEMRQDGRLLAYAGQIRCPVVAIHGDFDPHPAQGVSEPLAKKLDDFRFILLSNCGHKPWIERQAKDQFYEILKDELQTTAY